MINIGKLLMTTKISETLQQDPSFTYFLQSAIRQYQNGDWGKTEASDAQINNMALEYKERILAVYESTHGDFWIITDFYEKGYYETCFGTLPSDTNDELYPVTTILFPCEY